MLLTCIGMVHVGGPRGGEAAALGALLLREKHKAEPPSRGGFYRMDGWLYRNC